MVHDDGPVGLDCVAVAFDDERAVADARIVLGATLGTFLRAFTFGHVRQLDLVLGQTLTRAWQAGAGRAGKRQVGRRRLVRR